MNVFTPWLGICHLRQVDDGRPDAQPTLVAVWADSIERFERELHVHTNSHGLQMIWTEDVMSAEEWLTKHPSHKDGQRLAGKVSAKHLVALGGFGVGATGLGAYGLSDGEAEGYLHIEEIEGVEPLDAQFGVHPLKTVPDALYEPLFGQPEPSAAEVVQYGGADKVPPLNTYAILDAAKVVNFVVMLEASGLEYRCLFKGKAAEEMRDVAPYVVRLEEGNDFTRNLFSKDPEQDVPWFMWDKKPGIYVRSRGALADMWKHFRKFTKVQDENGKWFYFRFWEPIGATAPLFDFISDNRKYCEAWFCLQSGERISNYIYAHYKNNALKSASLNSSFEANGSRAVQAYSKEQRMHGVKYLVEMRCYLMARRLKHDFKNELAAFDSAAIQARLMGCIERMKIYGIQQQEYMTHVFVWDLLIGESFEKREGYEHVLRILESKKREAMKFDMVKHAMKATEVRSGHG